MAGPWWSTGSLAAATSPSTSQTRTRCAALGQRHAPEGYDRRRLLSPLTQVLASRVSKVPKWQRDCFLQFILPILVIALLFLVSYVLVVLGPLKGISGTHPAGAGPGVGSAHGAGSPSGVTIELDPPGNEL